jgi:ubiquinol-cytochrome c reductase cytochrome c1 subunit
MRKQILSLVLCALPLLAWGEEVKLEKVQIDPGVPAIERGVGVFMDTCHSCHNLKYVKWRELAALGVDKAKIKIWQGDQSLDAPLMGMMPDDAAMQSFGKIPPDLSMMVSAREGGVSYLYSYLMAYYAMPDGNVGNHVFPVTKMPDPLGISDAKDPAQRAEIQEKARDVVSFLAWAADPHEQERYKLGYYVIGYLIVLTGLLYLMKVKVWSRLK